MFKSVTPIAASRSRRIDRGRGVTTGRAGKIIPLRYIPLLREDQLKSCNFSITLEMEETVRPLVNSVYADVECWFVPFAAFDRFADLGDFNRSYAKIADPKTSLVEPFIKTGAWAVNDIWKSMGIHMPTGATVNLAPIEAYNCLVNHKYQERSPNLTARSELLTTLAPCFWAQNKFAHVVPNYDRSYIDGLVPIGYSQPVQPVLGLGVSTGVTTRDINGPITIKETGGNFSRVGLNATGTATGGDTTTNTQFYMEADATGKPMININLGNSSAHISLANIDLARKEAAFDALRTKYAGHNDAEIIELLMEGIKVPEFMERMPMLLGARRTQFSFGTRYATDGSNLGKSVTNGVAQVGMQITTPRTNTGGVLMLVASVVPDQLYERKRDPFLSITDQDLWPKYERDSLQTVPVDQILGADVDTSHATPAAIFGYEAMNQRWQRDFVRLGGKLYRPSSATAWTEDRAVLWVTEPTNPTLTADWYLATNINADPFADRVADHLTITTLHEGTVEGHTVFGPPLLEIPAV